MNVLRQTVLERGNDILTYGEKGAWGKKLRTTVLITTELHSRKSLSRGWESLLALICATMDEMVGKSALKSIYVNEPLEFDLISNNE
jgi:hypothetical protein